MMILLVEDDPVKAHLIMRALGEQHDYTVFESYKEGQICIRNSPKDSFDLGVFDDALPTYKGRGVSHGLGRTLVKENARYESCSEVVMVSSGEEPLGYEDSEWIVYRSSDWSLRLSSKGYSTHLNIQKHVHHPTDATPWAAVTCSICSFTQKVDTPTEPDFEEFFRGEGWLIDSGIRPVCLECLSDVETESR